MRDGLPGRSTALDLGTIRRVDRAPLLCQASQRAHQCLAWNHGVDTGDASGLVTRAEIGAVVPLAAGSLQVQRGVLGAPIDRQDGARHLDAREIEGLIALRVTLASDNVFSDGSALELATVTGSAAGGMTVAV
jgi:hypothetical protein